MKPHALFAVFVVVSALPIAPARLQLEWSVESRPASPEPRRPALTDSVAQRIERIGQRIDELRERGEYAEAISLAEELLAVRHEYQRDWINGRGEPAEWYEIGDARRMVEDLRLRAAMTPEQHAELEDSYARASQAAALYTAGRYDEAISLAAEQLDVLRRLLGEDHADVATCMDNLSVFYQAAGDYAHAETLCRMALETRQQLLGAEHPDVASSLSNLGALLYGKGDYAGAESLLSEALAVEQRLLGSRHPSVVTSLNNLAALLKAEGEYSEAERLYREGLTLSREIHGPKHSNVAGIMSNLAELLKAKGDLAGAESLHREALAMRRELFGEAHPLVAVSLNNLAALMQERGQYVSAELMYRETVAVKRATLGNEHPGVALSLNNLAQLLKAKGDYDAATSLHRDALTIWRNVVGEEHLYVALSLNNIGNILEAQGDYVSAEVLYRDALAMRRKLLGNTHPEVAGSLNNLASVLCAQGNYAAAEPLLREALAIDRAVLGDDHPDTATIIDNLAALLGKRGDCEVAEQLHRDSLSVRRKLLGQEHPDVATCLDNLARLLCAQGYYARAEPVLREALRIRDSNRAGIIGSERERAQLAGEIHLAETATLLTETLLRLGRHNDALDIAERGRGRAVLDLLTRSTRDLIADARRRGSAEAAVELNQVIESEYVARVAVTGAENRFAAVRKRADLGDKRQEAVDKLTEDLNRARRRLHNAESAVFAKLKDVWPDSEAKTAVELRAALAPGEWMLCYTWGEDAISLLAVPPRGEGDIQGAIVADGSDAVADLNQLAAEVYRDLTESAARRVDPEQQVARRRELWERLMPPIVHVRILAAERVVVLPDGPLSSIPFEALTVGDAPASAWIEIGPQVAYAESGTIYVNRRSEGRARAAVPGRATALVLGDPIFETHRRKHACPKRGVYVKSVAGGSNAAAAGLRQGDVIFGCADAEVNDVDALITALSGTADDSRSKTEDRDPTGNNKKPIRYWRAGEIHETFILPGPTGAQLAHLHGAESPALLTLRAWDEASAEAAISATDQVRLHGGVLKPLPGTRYETTSIARTVRSAGGNTAALLGKEAKVSTLESAVEGKRFVHFATHGLTGSRTRPYDASLALTQPEEATARDIGFLTLDHLVRDWRGKLAACDLVVLSACDTQRGVKVGDSMMALPIGFMYAGAPTVVASLWKVDDTATALLMVRFYENLLGVFDEPRPVPWRAYASGEAMSKVNALREAKLWLRSLTNAQVRALCEAHELPAPGPTVRGEPGPLGRTGHAARPFDHPYFWSSFILIGDPG